MHIHDKIPALVHQQIAERRYRHAQKMADRARNPPAEPFEPGLSHWNAAQAQLSAAHASALARKAIGLET